MEKYTIQQLATLAGITVRTLHHYDKIGLLKPASRESNNYRRYGEAELMKLQQIMFFRELEFPLNQIKAILESVDFDTLKALYEHKKLIAMKRQRMDDLLKTIDKTIKKINKEKNMRDEELYDGFSKEELEAWNKEAKKRWGHTDAYKQSVGKYENLSKEEKLKMKEEGDVLMEAFVTNMDKGPKSAEVQALVQKHYDSLRFFYEPNLEMYRGLADMYAGYQGDERFRAYFEKYDKKLPEFMRDAIYAYCDAQK